MTTTTREDVRAAFKAVLDAANLGVTVYDRLPFEGADANSVVLGIVSGTSKGAGVGMRENPGKHTVLNYYHLQIDCNADDKTACAKLADAVEQAIWAAHDTLRDIYDIRGLQKILDVDSLPLGASLRVPVLTREARVILDFSFWTHREWAG